MNKRTIDLTNKQFGQWTVIRFAGYKNRNAEWICKCTCGIEKPVRAMYLLAGTSSKCQACALPTRATIENTLPNAFWRTVKYNASKRNVSLEVNKKETFDLLVKQNFKCALSGLDLYMAKNASEHSEKKTTASLDRIDSNKPYTLDNIQWVHKDINMMKHIFDENYFLYLCHKVVEQNPEIKNYTYTKKPVIRAKTAITIENLKNLWIDKADGMNNTKIGEKYNINRRTVFEITAGLIYIEESKMVKK